MKPAPFSYHRPGALPDALATLADLGPDGKVLAGGQSLLPILSMRLASPAHLVDIGRLTDLAYVRSGPDGVRVGALARHAQVERDDAAHAAQPLLRRALRLVAHPTIRNRGTSVGSLAHADPSGELGAVLALTGGSVALARAGSGPATPADGERREVPAAEFFVAPLESAIQAGELAVEAFFPVFPAGTGSAFVEVSRRHGDYAVCGVAAAVTLREDVVTSARVGYISCSPTPVAVDVTAAAPSPGHPLVGDAAGKGPASAWTTADWAGAAEIALPHLEPEADVHASAAYRTHLVRVLTARALIQAGADALALTGGAA